ncbi:hypothetical protein [Aquimarina sp. AU58]|uniref:hypothetical protein n=1 Tax=Aquimarina sp. AU58 TaxID=1874112 RepID=UPI000D6E5D43|nr:hypothetical protein [Aquimarina sp. AU58]
MIISMQGDWNVKVKAKSASYPQRFIVIGADTGNGTHSGTVGTTVNVTGDQWAIAIQNDPGGGYQQSDTKIKFPKTIGGNHSFEILSNDAGGDSDFNDLVLECSTPVNINDFLIYGHVSMYSGRCLFNPCWRGPFVIDTYVGLLEALKNNKIKKYIEKIYPERIPEDIGPFPPDPAPFKPMVIDLKGEATKPKTELLYQRLENPDLITKKEAKEKASEFAATNYKLINTRKREVSLVDRSKVQDLKLVKAIEGLYFRCNTEPANNITLTFEEYDRTAAELAGDAYTGEGNRRLLGDTITDMNGNYIFRFSFDMSFPGIEDSSDQAPGENINVVAYPDVIVKVTSLAPNTILYESAPYYNIPNKKRINLCLPKSQIQPSSACFNGNLIGSLGNVFIGGNQNTTASFFSSQLHRNGFNNDLEPNGKISVNSSLAGFKVDCAAWGGTIDMTGCMYDVSKTATQNKIKWYTIRIKRSGTIPWVFVSQNYKHPRYSKRNLPNYNGDDVGPFYNQLLKVDGGPAVSVPAYKNIQREMNVDHIDWVPDKIGRYMQLRTSIYDKVQGETKPGTFYVRVDGYDGNGNPVANATDMIALYIHNKPLNFNLSALTFADTSIVNAGCGLYRLEDYELNTEINFNFRANDPYGFVDSYALTMSRCPGPMIGLRVNTPNPPLSDTVSGDTIFSSGNASGNEPHACVGYSGTLQEFSDVGLINAGIQPALTEGGWIKANEYFTRLSFHLTARKRITNGYNSGLSSLYQAHRSILMERINLPTP